MATSENHNSLQKSGKNLDELQSSQYAKGVSAMLCAAF